MLATAAQLYTLNPLVAISNGHMLTNSSNPLFIKGGIDFLKFGNKDRDEIFFLERKGLN